MGSHRPGQKNGSPKYAGPTLDVSGMELEEVRELARYIDAKAPAAVGPLIVGDAPNALRNLAGVNAMNRVEQAAYAALHPAVAKLVGDFVAWRAKA